MLAGELAISANHLRHIRDLPRRLDSSAFLSRRSPRRTLYSIHGSIVSKAPNRRRSVAGLAIPRVSAIASYFSATSLDLNKDACEIDSALPSGPLPSPWDCGTGISNGKPLLGRTNQMGSTGRLKSALHGLLRPTGLPHRTVWLLQEAC